MNLTYATFDTLTIDAEMARGGLAGPLQAPLAPMPRPTTPPSAPHAAPLLARLPRLTAAPTQPAPLRERVDAPATRLVGTHAAATQTFAIDTHVAATDAIATIHRAASPSIEALAAAPATTTTTTQRPAPRDEMTELLLGWDAAVAPYARWIVLAALFAALGLTLVLLRGGDGSSLGDTPSISPRAAVASPGELAAPSAPEAGIVSAAAAPWGASASSPMPTTGRLASIADGSRATAGDRRPLHVALGPVAAPPKAVLEQRVLEPAPAPLGSTPASPRLANLPPTNANPLVTPLVTGPYPSTSVGSPWDGNASGSLRR
jgi:hypothetical protein